MYPHYKKGLISIATLLGLLSFFIYVTKVTTPVAQPLLVDAKAHCYVDSIIELKQRRYEQSKKAFYHKKKATVVDSNPQKTSAVKSKSVFKQKDINKVTSYELLKKHHFPQKIANRVINYRTKLKGYTTMQQLEKVYGITNAQLQILKKYYKVIN